MPSDDTIFSEESSKADSAFRTIGEVAEELAVPQHILRFWERKFDQLAPVKRRGRRYYRPEDIELLQQIQHLLYNEAYTVKGVQQYLAKHRKSDAAQSDLFTSAMEFPEISEILHSLYAAQARLREALRG